MSTKKPEQGEGKDAAQTPPEGDGGASGAPPGADSPEAQQQEPETFPRKVVEDLRRENAAYRDRAKRADEAARRLAEATVREATAGILADASDLAWSDELNDDDGWPDPEKIAQAARELVQRKAHLGARTPTGDVGQGQRGEDTPTVSLAGLLRAGAG